MKLSVLITILVLLVGCTTSSPRDYARENGEKLLMDSGSYSALIQRYQTELNQSPDPEVRHKLANVHYLVGDVEAAMFQLSQISPRQRNTAELALLRANVFFDQGKINSAETHINAALRLDEELGEAHNLRGLILADKGDLLDAKASFESARTFNFDDATVKNNLAMIAILQGDFDKAIDTLLPLVQSGRADDVANANLILALAKDGRTRAFSQMLPGSEDDAYLADKFESLHNAKIKHNQIINNEKPSMFVPTVSQLNHDAVTQPNTTHTTSAAQTLAKVTAISQKTTESQRQQKVKSATAKQPEEQPQRVEEKTIKKASLSETIKTKTAFTEPKKIDPLQLARERVKAANDKKIATQHDAELAAIMEEKVKIKPIVPTDKPKKRSRRLITAFQYQPASTTGDGSIQYVATSDFDLGKVRTMFLEDRNKWVFDVKGAKDFTVKRKRFLSKGPAKIVELGEHNNYVRIVLTVRDNTKGKPTVIVDGKTLTIRWEA
ncbi:tetratricopeptide repeat protein [Enterovibrio norvegicus]|uniref:Uncharacterized protein n=1 Tax=Enterovibrio norvegicus TaxID=188144 RepID=A0A2N7L835_9GAMM|nr:tetratricopeptide repeat protein [Enterovibrio norvegicus]PMN90267.1 hypothetical protein BCT23_20925 [Enterovibrio norvegicus]